MTRMRAVKLLLASVVFLLTTGLFSVNAFSVEQTRKKENLFIFVFKEGVAQKDIVVTVGEARGSTNEFGLASFTQPAGEYEVGYYKGDELFALTEVALLETVSSQIFLNLSSEGDNVELDLPLSAYEQEFDHQDVKPQAGPKGTLIFSVKDSTNEKSIAGAKLFFKGYAIEASTDEKGIATVELAAGEYDISVIHPKYVMQVSKEVPVKVDRENEHSVQLIKADIVLDEFVVSAPFVEGSLASNIAELKDSDVVGDAISSEQFSKSGDSDAAGALKRVTGITIVDGKFVYVRGLGERYSSVLLNDLEVPSPEPTKRVVPLDIFPAGVIQSMDIQKTYSSNLPGTFGGGTILINSKDIPKEDNYIKGSISISMNEHTGDTVVYNDDNDKALPGLLIDKSNGFQSLQDEVAVGDTVLVEGLSAEERLALDSAMTNYRDYGISETKLNPGMSVSTSFGQAFKTSNGIKYGFAGNLYYKNDEKYEEDSIENTLISVEGGLVSDREKEIDKSTLTEKFGGLLSFGFEPLEGQKLKYTFLGVSEAEDQTKFSEKSDITEDSYSEEVRLRYIEKELFTHQLNGNHSVVWNEDALFKGVEVDWGYSNSTASRLEPGTFEYEYKESASGEGLALDRNKMFYQYSNLEDEVTNYRVDLGFPFEINGRDNKLNFGLYQLNKERTLDNRRFKFNYKPSEDDVRGIDDILTEELAITDSLWISDNFREDDAYLAEQDLSAFYTSALIALHDDIDIYVGARNESSTQDLEVGIQEDSLQTYSLETSDTLPFASLTYRLNDEHQFRLGFSQTLSRPDFRDFSPTRYKHPETDYIVRGNPELTYTEISNIDFKYEWFPSFDELMSVGVFVKDFTNPIETLRQIADEDIEISYANAQGAQSLGLEFGFRKNLEGLFSSLENYFVEGNYTWVDSEVNLRQEDIESNNLTSNDRAMQGQSPYILNFNFGYDNFFTRRSAMFLYNVYGKRISALGINGTPDVLEQPFHRLDFVVKWGLNDTYDDQEKRIGYTVSLKLKNLLDSEKEHWQGGKIVEYKKPGRSASLGFSMKF